MMTNLRTRLAWGNAVLKLLDLRRAQTRDPRLGEAVEKRILDRELADLARCTRARWSGNGRVTPPSPLGIGRLPR